MARQGSTAPPPPKPPTQMVVVENPTTLDEDGNEVRLRGSQRLQNGTTLCTHPKPNNVYMTRYVLQCRYKVLLSALQMGRLQNRLHSPDNRNKEEGQLQRSFRGKGWSK